MDFGACTPETLNLHRTTIPSMPHGDGHQSEAQRPVFPSSSGPGLGRLPLTISGYCSPPCSGFPGMSRAHLRLPSPQKLQNPEGSASSPRPIGTPHVTRRGGRLLELKMADESETAVKSPAPARPQMMEGNGNGHEHCSDCENEEDNSCNRG